MLTEHRAVQELLPSKAAAILLRGDPAVRTLAMDLAAATILTGGTVLWVEAANRFDLYGFAEAAPHCARVHDLPTGRARHGRTGARLAPVSRRGHSRVGAAGAGVGRRGPGG